MFQQFETMQKLSKDNVDAALKSFGTVSKGVQTAAAEAADYSKKSFEHGSAALEKLMGARSLDKVLEIQGDFLKSSYEGLVAQATKMGELYTAIAKDAVKPYEGVIAKASAPMKG